MKKLSLYSFLLFIVPLVTLTVCHQLHVSHVGVQTIPFIDGKVSVSLIGRQEYSIGIFKPAFFSYALISIFFYFKISNFFLLNGIKNKFKIYGTMANFFLCIYIIALGQRDSSFYEILRRLAVIFYIANIKIASKGININNRYLSIFIIRNIIKINNIHKQ